MSNKINQEKIKEKNINKQDNKELPFFPKKRVKKKEEMELNNGKKNTDKYINNY